MRAPPTRSKTSVAAMRRKRNAAAANSPRLSNAGVVEIATDSGCVIATLRRPAARNRISGAMARELMAQHSVPVVVEFILERVTNIAMGTEIDNVVEFEELAKGKEDAPTAVALLD